MRRAAGIAACGRGHRGGLPAAHPRDDPCPRLAASPNSRAPNEGSALSREQARRLLLRRLLGAALFDAAYTGDEPPS